MAESDTCPVCATPLPRDAPEGFCPRCLAGLAAGIAPDLFGDKTGTDPAEPQSVRYFGDYELLAEIAAGGMGVVYRARQISLNRTVALKMIRAGQFATPAEVQRFRTETEAAANLDHPHILPLYEVGEHEGRHYFSMKLVEGGSLAERIGERQSPISTRESARLIAILARAVHHAHQRGVLHRDLKPTNILLDQKGEPHLTDFGLAKLVQSGGDLTQTLAILGTPHYMAPEQAAGRAREVTTAADIYSLGAILYELLVGHPPFQGESAIEVLQNAQHREPGSPRKTNPSLDRDLETICLKCLEKEPSRRYDTADTLAEDLDHWLGGEPIQARRVSRAERVLKWARRNPALATLIVVAHLLFAGGVIGVVWEWHRAEAEAARANANATRAERHAEEEAAQRRQAEANAQRAELEAARSAEIAQLMKDMLDGVGPSVALGRETSMLREIMDQAAHRLDNLKTQPLVEADLRTTLGLVYFDLGDFQEARRMHREALRLRRAVLSPADPLIAAALCNLGEALVSMGEVEPGNVLLRESLAMRRRLFGDHHLEVGHSLAKLADGLMNQQKHAEAENAHREALAIYRAQLGNESFRTVEILNDLTSALLSQGKLAEAEVYGVEALAICRMLTGEEHPTLATCLLRLGSVYRRQQQWIEAEALIREAVAMRRKMLGEEHPYVLSSSKMLAALLKEAGRSSETELSIREALASRRRLIEQEHIEVASLLQQLADMLAQQQNLAESESLHREALALRIRFLGPEHETVANSFGGLARVLQEQKKFAESEQFWREALVIRRNVHGDSSLAVGRTLFDLGWVLRNQGRLDEAEALYRESMAITRKLLGDEHSEVSNAMNHLAAVMFLRGDLPEAERLHRDVLTIRRKTVDNDSLSLFWVFRPLARVLKDQGKMDEAEELGREALRIGRIHFGDHAEVAYLLEQLANVLGANGKLVEAESLYREALALRRKLFPAGHPGLAEGLASFTTFLLAGSQFAQAEPLARECLAIREKVIPEDWLTFNTRSLLGGSLLGQMKHEEAEPLLLSGYEGLKDRENKIRADVRTARLTEALERLVQLYEATEKPGKAAEWKMTLADFENAEAAKAASP